MAGGVIVALWCLAVEPPASYLGQARSAWLAAARSQDPARRQAAAFALGKMGATAETAARLVELLDDPDGGVQENAALALAAWGPVAPEAAIPSLRGLLDQSAAAAVRRAALLALGEMGPAAIAALPAVQRRLRDPEPTVRQAALRAAVALSLHRPESLLAEVRARLRDEDALVRHAAARAVAELGPWARPLVADLLERLDDVEMPVRWAALHALASLGPAADASQDALLKMVRQPQTPEPLRRQALLALCALGRAASAAAEPELRAACAGDDATLRRAAGTALLDRWLVLGGMTW